MKCSTDLSNAEPEQPSGEWAEPLSTTRIPDSTGRDPDQSPATRLDLLIVVVTILLLIGITILASSR